MTLTILSDADVRAILHSLTLDEVRELQHNLAEALHEYSTGTQETGGCSSANQPARAQIKTRDSTTLFMPAKSGTTSGVKIVTLMHAAADRRTSEDRSAADPPRLSDPLRSSLVNVDTRTARVAAGGIASPQTGSPRGGSRSSSPSFFSRSQTGSPRPRSPVPSSPSLAHRPSAASSVSTASGLSGTTARTERSAASTPTSSSTPSLAAAAPAVSHGSSGAGDTQGSARSAAATTPQGTLTLLTATGTPLALINAGEVTAFRTALAATLLLSKRQRVHSICVFGAGKQAYWHIRLALLLRGSEIHHVRIINRSFAGAEPLLREIYTAPEWAALRQSNTKLGFSVLSAEYGEYARLLKEQVREADAIFCCTPSTHPLFPAEFLTSSEGRKKGRYLSLIGSYQPHMLEVHPDVLRQAVAPDHKHHHHRHAKTGGVVVVDGLEACLKEAGEIIQAGLNAAELVEVGELIMVRKAAMKEVEMGQPGEPGLKRWLESGNVIYKSVGLGLMDLCVGEDLVTLAAERGVGVRVDDF